MSNADNTAIHHHASGGVSLTGDAIHLYRVLTIRSGLSLLIRTNGKLRLTKSANPKALLQIVHDITGKKYPNSPTGWSLAVAELDQRIAALKASIPQVDSTTTNPRRG